MGSKAGALQVAAKRIGISVDEYLRNISDGFKWCHVCKSWRERSSFSSDRSRNDGLTASCRDCRSKTSKSKYQPRDRKRGRRYAVARDGDQSQARGRVNHLSRVGVLPKPNKVPCVDCGHVGDDRRHEFDHFAGYQSDQHELVEVVCSKCHSKRHPKSRCRNPDGTFRKEA